MRKKLLKSTIKNVFTGHHRDSTAGGRPRGNFLYKERKYRTYSFLSTLNKVILFVFNFSIYFLFLCHMCTLQCCQPPYNKQSHPSSIAGACRTVSQEILLAWGYTSPRETIFLGDLRNGLSFYLTSVFVLEKATTRLFFYPHCYRCIPPPPFQFPFWG